jgi:lipoprotein-anchoring transpeptidase ErfK/SrfK
MAKKVTTSQWQPPVTGPGAIRRPGAAHPQLAHAHPQPAAGLLAGCSAWLARTRGSWASDPRLRLRVTAAAVAAVLAGGVAGVATIGGPLGLLAAGSTSSGAPAAQGQLQLSLLPPIALPALPALPDLSSLLPAPAPAAPVPAPAPSPSPAVTDPASGIPASSLVADATGSSIAIFGSPGGAEQTSIPGTNSIGQREAFLVVGQSPGWYQVELPIKPTGSLGWIRAGDVTTRTDTYFIQVTQSAFQLKLFNNGQLIDTFPVAVGLPATPTPNGHFFVWAEQHYNYAPYAVGIFALSAFSPVLVNWPGGGRTGIHGWDDPSVIGHAASNGCVRMSGADFQALINSVPLGTPVTIQP